MKERLNKIKHRPCQRWKFGSRDYYLGEFSRKIEGMTFDGQKPKVLCAKALKSGNVHICPIAAIYHQELGTSPRFPQVCRPVYLASWEGLGRLNGAEIIEFVLKRLDIGKQDARQGCATCLSLQPVYIIYHNNVYAGNGISMILVHTHHLCIWSLIWLS